MDHLSYGDDLFLFCTDAGIAAAGRGDLRAMPEVSGVMAFCKAGENGIFAERLDGSTAFPYVCGKISGELL